MPVKDLNVTYKGKKIRVENTWFSGAKLYIDGDCRDTTIRLIALDKERPILSASIETDTGSEIIEVFIIAVMNVKIKIHANGEMIAGENF